MSTTVQFRGGPMDGQRREFDRDPTSFIVIPIPGREGWIIPTTPGNVRDELIGAKEGRLSGLVQCRRAERVDASLVVYELDEGKRH